MFPTKLTKKDDLVIKYQIKKEGPGAGIVQFRREA